MSLPAFSDALTDAQTGFLAGQPIFYLAVATEGLRVTLEPRAMADLRVLAPDLIACHDAIGEMDAPSIASGARVTLMACALDAAPRLLRLYGHGRIVRPTDDEWHIVSAAFGRPETGRILLVPIESVEENTGPVLTAASAQAPTPQGADRHSAVDPGWVAAVLNYWLNEIGPDGWFESTDEEDARCLHLFRALWEALRNRPADAFLEDADTALAALVLFDQLPRNMFRHEARAFATDALAREIADKAIVRGFDHEFRAPADAFFYMPFMHSESMADQQRSLALFSQPGMEQNLRFALAHHAMIARYGRFPHRNAALGREDRPEEEEAIAEGADW